MFEEAWKRNCARTCSSRGTLRTDGTVRISGDLETGASVRAGARLAVRGRAGHGVAVVALGAALAVVAGRVVLARALARLGVADVGVVVAAARDAPGERTAVVLVVEAILAHLAELALVAARAVAPRDRS